MIIDSKKIKGYMLYSLMASNFAACNIQEEAHNITYDEFKTCIQVNQALASNAHKDRLKKLDSCIKQYESLWKNTTVENVESMILNKTNQFFELPSIVISSFVIYSYSHDDELIIFFHELYTSNPNKENRSTTLISILELMNKYEHQEFKQIDKEHSLELIKALYMCDGASDVWIKLIKPCNDIRTVRPKTIESLSKLDYLTHINRYFDLNNQNWLMEIQPEILNLLVELKTEEDELINTNAGKKIITKLSKLFMALSQNKKKLSTGAKSLNILSTLIETPIDKISDYLAFALTE